MATLATLRCRHGHGAAWRGGRSTVSTGAKIARKDFWIWAGPDANSSETHQPIQPVQHCLPFLVVIHYVFSSHTVSAADAYVADKLWSVTRTNLSYQAMLRRCTGREYGTDLHLCSSVDFNNDAIRVPPSHAPRIVRYIFIRQQTMARVVSRWGFRRYSWKSRVEPHSIF